LVRDSVVLREGGFSHKQVYLVHNKLSLLFNELFQMICSE